MKERRGWIDRGAIGGGGGRERRDRERYREKRGKIRNRRVES